MPVHQFPGQGDRIHGFNSRIFRQDIGHQIIGISFDDAADQGQPPQKRQDAGHKTGDSHMAPFFDPQQEPQSLRRNLFITAPFQKHPQHHGSIDADHKDFQQEHQGQSADQQNDDRAAVRSGQRSDAQHQGHQVCARGYLIDDRSQYAPAPPQDGAGIDQRILHIPRFRFPDLLLLAFRTVLRDLHHKFQERGDDGAVGGGGCQGGICLRVIHAGRRQDGTASEYGRDDAKQ